MIFIDLNNCQSFFCLLILFSTYLCLLANTFCFVAFFLFDSVRNPDQFCPNPALLWGMIFDDGNYQV